MNRCERLPRPEAEFYRGRAIVHWTMAMEKRATGWLDARFHAGLREASDQRVGVRMLRRYFGELLPGGFSLQRQAHDHVLREKERQRGAFEAAAGYVLRNPERAGVVERWEEYGFCGSIVAGYPSLDPRREKFWESFWMAFEAAGK